MYIYKTKISELDLLSENFKTIKRDNENLKQVEKNKKRT